MGGSRRIYVASSRHNVYQQGIVHALREAGHEVFDFRDPRLGQMRFSWSEIDPGWLDWDPLHYVGIVRHSPAARAGFAIYKAALDWCDTCVLVLPCGRNAHLEAGHCAGQGKRTIVYLRPEKFQPELMYLLGHGFALDIPSLVAALAAPDPDFTSFAALEDVPVAGIQP